MKIKMLSLFLLFLPWNAKAQLIGPSFWKLSTPYLVFNNVVSSINAGFCSSAINVQSTSPAGTPRNVGSNLTVNLSSSDTGMVFYSDSLCINPISTINISTGTSATASFYFMTSTVGTVQMTSSASGYRNGSKSLNSSTYPFTWTGNGGNANWNTAGNWSGGAVPGVNDYAVFDGSCVANCSPTINANVSIRGLRIQSDYAGTITQSAAITITTADGGWIQRGGTFIGSSGETTIGSTSVSSNIGFIQTGGTFTGGSGAITVNTYNYSGISFYLTGGTFTSTSGTLKLDETWMWGSPSNITFFKIVSGATFNHNNGTVNFSGKSSAGSGEQGYTLDVGTNLNLYNVTLSGDGGYGGGHALPSGQTITVLNTFNQTGGGILTPLGTASSTSGEWHLQGVSNSFLSGTRSDYSNYGIVVFDGTGNQTYTCGMGSVGYGPQIRVNKASGSLTTVSANCYFANLSLLQGSFTAPSGTLTLGFITGSKITSPNWNVFNIAAGTTFDSNNATVAFEGRDQRWGTGFFTITVPNSFILNNVVSSIGTGDCCGAGLSITSGSIVAVGTFSWTGGALRGTWEAQGTVTLNSAYGGTANFIFSGTQSPQIINGATLATTGDITVNHSAGGIQLASALSANNTGQTLNVTSGTVDMNAFALTVKALSLNGNILTKNGGVLTVNGTAAGTGALYGGTVNP